MFLISENGEKTGSSLSESGSSNEPRREIVGNETKGSSISDEQTSCMPGSQTSECSDKALPDLLNAGSEDHSHGSLSLFQSNVCTY